MKTKEIQETNSLLDQQLKRKKWKKKTGQENEIML